MKNFGKKNHIAPLRRPAILCQLLLIILSIILSNDDNLVLSYAFVNTQNNACSLSSLSMKNHHRRKRSFYRHNACLYDAKTSTETETTTPASTENEVDQRDMSNPSTAFGQPLSDNVKDFDKFAVSLIKNVVFDILFADGNGKNIDRSFARFYALETIARMPYFAYTSVLHFYETFGKYRKVEYLKIHFAEDWNELHHLLIMEELGGNSKWFDRFIAQHIALVYYFMVFVAYVYNPTLAYNLNEAVEGHAAATYNDFLLTNEEQLKSLPAPDIAKEYYRDGDLYMFDEFQTSAGCSKEPRRPKMDTLYDCFVAIRDDEIDHQETMNKLQTSVQLTTPHSFQTLEECVIEYDDITGVPTIVST